ncbi:MAG: FecR/PupR family sigma factor regulator [Pseudomonadota bacterium]
MPRPITTAGFLDPSIREALGWILRLTSGDATQGDSERLAVWRASSPERERAYREAVRCWRALAPALRDDYRMRCEIDSRCADETEARAECCPPDSKL